MSTTTNDTTTPAALMRAFTARVHGRDLDGLVALYETAAVFESQPGVVVSGADAIRSALGRPAGPRARLTAATVQVLEAGDIALVVNEWSMTGTGPDGSQVQRVGRSADVVRRQADGRWLVVIDKP